MKLTKKTILKNAEKVRLQLAKLEGVGKGLNKSAEDITGTFTGANKALPRNRDYTVLNKKNYKVLNQKDYTVLNNDFPPRRKKLNLGFGGF